MIPDYLDIRNCDNMDLMTQFPDKHFDLAIVDPPYGLPKDSSNGRGKLKGRVFNNGGISRWDFRPNEEYFTELMRVSKAQIIWGGNYFALPPSRCIICWDKVQPWENFSQIELAWTSFDYPAQIFKFDNRTGGKIHPTQKPIELYRWIIKKYCKKGMKILDTHLGSASIAIAIHDMNEIDQMKLTLTASEIDSHYYESAIKRVELHTLQKSIFS